MKLFIIIFLFFSNISLAKILPKSENLRESIILKDEIDLEDTDLSTKNALIEKLESVLPEFTNNKTKNKELRLRLADLYSDRARIKDYQSNNCEKCETGAQDRKKAIEYYEQTKNDSPSARAHILLQLAHLYKMEDQTKKSQSIFNEILKGKNLKDHHIKAHLGLADIAFQNGQYKKAKIEYSSAIKTDNTNEKIYALYRLAWTELNTGKNKSALGFIQNALEIAKLNSKPNWQKDLMNDYATILSHLQFTKKDIDTYISYSEPSDRLDNFKFLAQEADRLGNKRGALQIWTEYSKESRKDKNDQDGAEVQFKLAEAFYDLNKYKESLRSLDEVILLTNNKKCTDCSQVAKDFRTLLISWSRKEKIDPSNDLVDAYKKYLSMVPTDYEAIIWAAQTAHTAKNNQQAILYYEQAAQLSKSNKKNLDLTTSAILDIGSEQKNSSLYQLSLLKYLELNPNGEKKFLVRYELAYLDYKNRKYEQAARQFEDLASDSSWENTKSREQAAELSIESNLRLKRNNEVFRAAQKYGKIFVSKSQHFSEIARKVTINNLATLLSKNDTKALAKELKILNTFNVEELEPKDRAMHYRSQILAAEKINDLDIIESASRNMLKVNALTGSDKLLALKSLLWVYELRLNFKNAFAIAKNLPMPELTSDQRYLKLGLLAELANENPTPYYEQYVRAAKTIEKANRIRLIMIRTSAQPWRTFESFQKILQRTPNLYSSIVLELHLKNPDWAKVKSALSIKAVRSTPSGIYLEKLVSRENFSRFTNDTGIINNKHLKKSIQTRVQYLKSLQGLYKRSHNDLTMQLLVLNKISLENSKFYNQLLQLPPPSALKSKEIDMYKTALSEQARPFLLASEHANQTKTQLIEDISKHLNELFEAVDSGDQIQKYIAMNEFSSLKMFLTKTQIKNFQEKLQNSEVNAGKVSDLREQIARNPLDLSPLIQLRGLEAKRADGPLLAYLDQRISQLKMRARR